MSDDRLAPADAAALQVLAGAHFLGGDVTLPSGRIFSADEVQALSSAYAPDHGTNPNQAEGILTWTTP